MKYICEICTKQYAKKDNLREHKRRIHGKFEDGAKFECDICHQLFINQSLVKYHRNMKHGIDYEGDAKIRIYTNISIITYVCPLIMSELEFLKFEHYYVKIRGFFSKNSTGALLKQ